MPRAGAPAAPGTESIDVPVGALRGGDVVLVRPGEALPAGFHVGQEERFEPPRVPAIICPFVEIVARPDSKGLKPENVA